MHALMFAAKRVHLRTVAFGHRLVRGVAGMTAARFDLISAILQEPGDPVFGRRQVLERVRGISALAGVLGLHRTTVSKMVKRLLEMGWLVARRSGRDRRRVGIALSVLGWRSYIGAMGASVRPIRSAVRRCFAGYGARVDHVVAAVVRLWWEVARFFWDRAVVLYEAPEARSSASASASLR